MSSFNPQNQSNTVWAFATMGVADTPLMTSIASSALKNIHDYDAQNLCNTSWAFATLAVLNQDLLNAISAEARPRIHDFIA